MPKRIYRLGDNKAISMVTYEPSADVDTGNGTLGVMVLIPVGHDQGKLVFRPFGIELTISAVERTEILKVLGGTDNGKT